MAYGIQLVHQNPKARQQDALWWQGPIRHNVRDEEWGWTYPGDEGRFPTLEAAQARADRMTPMLVVCVVQLP